MDQFYKKRAFDLVVVFLSAFLWLPVIIAGTVAIAICEGRPVFYVSTRRVGHYTIRVIKFRTMVRNAETHYNRDVVPISANIRFLNTPRDSLLYTKVGRVIERYGLTEVPQVIHVIKGDMSLVGNRPLPENVISSLKEAFPETEQRFATPSGMTGPVQLVGRTEMSDEERISIEREYCEIAGKTQSWTLDITILFGTVFVVLGLRRQYTVEEVRALIRRFDDRLDDAPIATPAQYATPVANSSKPAASSAKLMVNRCKNPDLLILEPQIYRDDRGFFLESYNRRELSATAGIEAEFVQDNHSYSVRGVLRGLHYQVNRPQGKLVRVLSGTVFDVAVDIRRGSPHFGCAVCVELSAQNHQMFWIAPGFAHGFLALSEVAELLYKTTDYRYPEDERCISWNDPDIAIPWPLAVSPRLSAKDRDGVLLRDAETLP